MSPISSKAQQRAGSPAKGHEDEKTGKCGLFPHKLSPMLTSPTAALMEQIPPHLVDVLSRNYDNPFVADVRPPPKISISPTTEQPAGDPLRSNSTAGRSSRSTSIFSREQSTLSTIPTQVEPEESNDHKPKQDDAHHTSPSLPWSVKATVGSSSVTSASVAEEIDYIWEHGDSGNQFGVFSSKSPPRHRRRRNKREKVVVVQHDRSDGRFISSRPSEYC
jgi:hypothetical protein